MDLTPLEQAGLKTNESRIYVCLLEQGLSLVSDIYSKLSIHRRNIYDALERLREKGLVTVVIKNGKKHFEAVPPEKLLEYVREKEEAIQQILPELQQRHRMLKSHEESLMFKGIEGMKTVMQDMLAVGQPMYLIGAKGRWLVNELRFYFPKFERERIKRKIPITQIFDHEMRQRKIPNVQYSKHKFFSKEYSSPTHIWIYGDRVVTAFWGDVPLAFMIKSDKIAKGYHKYFTFIWRGISQ